MPEPTPNRPDGEDASDDQHLAGQRPVGRPLAITPDLLRGWPLPLPDAGGDKEDRGSVLVVGGTIELPGAVILAATAALRAGAGKLQIGAPRSVAQSIAVTVPEARVFGLAESPSGGIDVSAAMAIAEHANRVAAALIGPGMMNETAKELLAGVIPRIEGAALVLDAGALECVADNQAILYGLNGNVVLTPHAGEMAGMLGLDKEQIQRDPAAVARRAAADLRAVVALKGAETYVATPDGASYCYHSQNIGLATSGSGDTLAGVVVGLLARGAEPAQAAAWAVYMHGTAGGRLIKRLGPLGFLARELLDEIPAVMAQLS